MSQPDYFHFAMAHLAEDFQKLAEDKPKKKEMHPIVPSVAGPLLFGAGTGLGFGAGYGGMKLYEHVTHKMLPPQYAIPAGMALGAGLTMAYNKAQEHLRRAVERHEHESTEHGS